MFGPVSWVVIVGEFRVNWVGDVEKQKISMCCTAGWMVKSERKIASEVVLFIVLEG